MTRADKAARLLANALREEGDAGETPKDALANEMLNHHRQRRAHKQFLFWSGLLGAGGIFTIFCCILVFCDRFKELLQITPFALIPISVLGFTPLLILIFLFRCVFRPSGDSTLIDKKDLEVLKEIAAIFK